MKKTPVKKRTSKYLGKFRRKLGGKIEGIIRGKKTSREKIFWGAHTTTYESNREEKNFKGGRGVIAGKDSENHRGRDSSFMSKKPSPRLTSEAEAIKRPGKKRREKITKRDVPTISAAIWGKKLKVTKQGRT